MLQSLCGSMMELKCSELTFDQSGDAVPFRNPLYMDTPLLKNLADYHDIDVPTSRQVTQRLAGSSEKRAGIAKVVDAGVQAGRETETTEVYATEVRPIRLVNDVIDFMLAEAELIDLTVDAEAQLLQRSVVQVEGELVPSPATEIGSLLSRFFPLLTAKYAAGESNPQLSQQDIALILTPQASAEIQVYDLQLEISDRNFAILLDPSHLIEGRELDDLEGERTVFGLVERLIPEGSSYPLARYLLPGMNRSLRRRAEVSGAWDELVKGFGEMMGQQLDMGALSVDGPAAIIQPVAIY